MNLKKINEKKEKFESGKKEKTILEKRVETIFELAETNSKMKKLLFISIIVVLIQGVGITYFATKENLKAMIVQVDKNTGAVLETNILEKSKFEVGEKETKYFINKFITDVRTLSIDVKYYEKKVNETKYFLTSKSQTKLDDMISDNVKKLSEKITNNVSIVSIIKMTNANDTYQVRWSEKYFNEAGEQSSEENYLGVFTIDYVENKDEEFIKYNPLGIIIKDFTISREAN